jgi:hypothetical protein
MSKPALPPGTTTASSGAAIVRAFAKNAKGWSERPRDAHPEPVTSAPMALYRVFGADGSPHDIWAEGEDTALTALINGTMHETTPFFGTVLIRNPPRQDVEGEAAPRLAG